MQKTWQVYWSRKEFAGFHAEIRQGNLPYQWRLQDSSVLISQGTCLHNSLQRCFCPNKTRQAPLSMAHKATHTPSSLAPTPMHAKVKGMCPSHWRIHLYIICYNLLTYLIYKYCNNSEHLTPSTLNIYNTQYLQHSTSTTLNTCKTQPL